MDTYKLINLYVAIIVQAIIDSYKGKYKDKQEVVTFFESDDFKDIVRQFRFIGLSFEKLFGFSGSFSSIPTLLKSKGGSELLYKSCAAVPYLEGIEAKKTTFVVEKTRVVPMPYKMKGVIDAPKQIAI